MTFAQPKIHILTLSRKSLGEPLKRVTGDLKKREEMGRRKEISIRWWHLLQDLTFAVQSDLRSSALLLLTFYNVSANGYW